MPAGADALTWLDADGVERRVPSIGSRLHFHLPSHAAVRAFVLIRDDRAYAIRPETIFQPGDKVIAISTTECETELHRQLIGSVGAGRA